MALFSLSSSLILILLSVLTPISIIACFPSIRPTASFDDDDDESMHSIGAVNMYVFNKDPNNNHDGGADDDDATSIT